MVTDKDKTSFCIVQDGWTYMIESDKLKMTAGGKEQVILPLAPIVNQKECSLSPWQKAGEKHFQATVKGVGKAHVGVRQGYVAFWMDALGAKIKEFETITYFPGTTFNGERWQSYVCDGWDRLWNKDVDKELGISSAYLDVTNVFGAEPGGQADPRDTPPTYIWNMPVRAFSLQTEMGFVGFSIPGALPVGIVRLTMRDRLFSVAFDTLRPACREGAMPMVYLVPGLNGAYDILDKHRIISEKLGLCRKKSSDHPAWWTKPTYKPSLEYIRRWQKIDPALKDERMKVISAENLQSWIYEVKDSLQQKEMAIACEQGIVGEYGDSTPVKTLGGASGFRRLVDGFRKKGIRVSYYIHPFMVNRKVAFFRKHPEAFCRPIGKGTLLKYNGEHLYDVNPKYALLDWTHPLGRKYLLSQVDFILSDKKGSLDCDWLRSNHWRSPDPRYFKFHDRDWGIGDLMSMKVQKLIYQRAKMVKPHCCVSKAAVADPYMQPYADVILLCEDHTALTKTWYERGNIATRTISDTAFITDPYFLSITKASEYYMAMLVWNVCEVPDVRHALHPYTCYLELRPKDYKRRLAGVKVQENAPINVTDIVRVERPVSETEEPVIWRKRTRGPLAGWYAALAISKRTFVTYSENEARVATTETRWIRVPIPPGAKLRAVEMVPHKGKAKKLPVKWARVKDNPCVELKVEDSADQALYYRIKYQLS